MLAFDPEKVVLNARTANTEDLLNRVTVFRNEMEPEALPIIEAELRSRGMTAADILDHGDKVKTGVQLGRDGTIAKCSFCSRPASAQRWGWHKLWGLVPVFPRPMRYCSVHNQPPR